MVISWLDYLATAFLVLVFYYAAILLIYYRKDIKHKLLSAKGSVAKPPIDRALFTSSLQEQRGDIVDATIEAPMHSLVDELQAYVSQSGKEGTEKEYLFAGIKKLLLKYPDIPGSIYQEGITNLIAVIAENNCAVHFSAEELSELWKT
ncbi:MAG TPA: hypothetical protein PLS00_00330 [Niabella sp.]|jgi:hypothetical protein|nr:hypothetical protein [Niabella sp.]